ncbi:nucleotidyltransferase family protein [Streptomyces sp. 184]|uniref:nucleotidyltransferase family protein n=1 Tax=Streptomyces sp. 184 TaxID=1827526 RepID=UPI003891FA40
MTTAAFPTPLHRTVLEVVLTELRADPDVRGVLLSGSLARGTARPDSDLDVLVVTATDPVRQAPWRSRRRPLTVDLVPRTAAQWRSCFAPDRVGDESWGYAFLDGVALHDPDGAVAGLMADAATIHAGYRTPEPIKAHYAGFWAHLVPKMQAVRQRGDPVETGWAAAVMTNELIRTLCAANDLPNPSLDVGACQRHLDDLASPAGAADLMRAVLRAAPRDALRLQLELVGDVLPLLTAPGATGPPPGAKGGAYR